MSLAEVKAETEAWAYVGQRSGVRLVLGLAHGSRSWAWGFHGARAGQGAQLWAGA